MCSYCHDKQIVTYVRYECDNVDLEPSAHLLVNAFSNRFYFRKDIHRRHGSCVCFFSVDVALFIQESDVDITLIFHSVYCLYPLINSSKIHTQLS